MSEPEHGDGASDDPETAFDRLERHRETMELLGQETRHTIVQTILAHPDGLASQAELCNVQAGKSRKAVTDQIARLAEAGLIAEYHHEANKSVRGEPANFYGLTVEGARTLGNLGYFEAAPMMRAVYARMRKDERIQRHENADRPPLPEKVRYALRLGEYDDDGGSGDGDGGDGTEVGPTVRATDGIETLADDLAGLGLTRDPPSNRSGQ
ncbi:MAG: DNA-binding MarR family transcriptional regulator [Natronomonas sp.]|jgi:DNA-binding MarR family transcriptional regulator